MCAIDLMASKRQTVSILASHFWDTGDTVPAVLIGLLLIAAPLL